MSKLFRGFVSLLLIVLISISLTSGLELTASTGSNGDSTSTGVTYGATVEDYAHEHIKLNPEQGTLSNAFTGTGDLPYSYVTITDSGNTASTWRGVTGIPGYTSWSYDWGTSKPYVSGLGTGVSAWLTMNVQNAYGIGVGSAAVNGATGNDVGDCTVAMTGIFSSAPTTSLSNYWTSASAYTSAVNAIQGASSSSGENAWFLGWSGNDEADQVLSSIAASGNSYVGIPITSTWAGKNFAYAYESTSGAYGSNYAKMSSHTENRGLAKEYLSGYDGTITPVPTNYGGADFVVQANALGNTQLETSAIADNVLITPTLPTGTKNAIMLEPFKNAFTSVGATDLDTTVFPDLVAKGYATLSYTDSGATSERFQNLGQYNVVLVDGHMNSNDIGLSTGTGFLPASQLNYQTSKNSLVVLAGCDSFNSYPQKSALASAVSNAGISGGYANSVNTDWNNDYLTYFFDALRNGNTASSANSNANTLATAKWGSGQYNIPLVFYPTNWQKDFKL